MQVRAGLAVVVTLAWLGCGDQGAPPPADPGPPPGEAPGAPPGGPGPAPAEVAEQEYSLRCVTCHGENGDGTGPGGAALQPPPRSFRDAAWQASVSDEHIERVIAYGGAAVGLSPIMPAQPDLAARPEVLRALREKVRSFGP